MSFKSILFLASLSLGAVHANTDLAFVSCEDYPGSELCKQMDSTTDSFKFTCTGAACYQLWRTQIERMNGFAEDANHMLPFSYAASPEMGELAWTLVDHICRATATGAANWMQALFNAKVQARDAAVKIQKRANVKSIRTCVLTLK